MIFAFKFCYQCFKGEGKLVSLTWFIVSKGIVTGVLRSVHRKRHASEFRRGASGTRPARCACWMVSRLSRSAARYSTLHSSQSILSWPPCYYRQLHFVIYLLVAIFNYIGIKKRNLELLCRFFSPKGSVL